MTGSIGKMAEDILAEVKDGKLTKLAEHVILDNAEKRASSRTELGRAALKLAAELRSNATSSVTVDDLRKFVDGIQS